MWEQDLKGALKVLKGRPSFTLAAVATLALGVGLTTTMFTVVNAVVLRPLPFPDSSSVVQLCETNPRAGDWCGASPANLADWARQSRTLESAGVGRNEPFIGRDPSGSFGITGGIASPGFFKVLKLTAAAGRLFEDADLASGANQVIVVSHGFWRQRLGADPGIVGRVVTVDDRPVSIIGVLPADAYVPELSSVEVWKPLSASADDTTNRAWRGFVAIGRMAPGTSVGALEAELNVLRANLAAVYPESNAGWGVRVADLRRQVVGPVDTALWLFLGAVGLVLVIACANVAGLLLVQGTRRAPEFAIRAALGASRSRLIRQLLTEGLVLSLAGGLVGLLMAAWATRWFVQVAPPSIPRLSEVSVDWRVALFALAVSSATAIVFGTAPAWHASRADVSQSLVGMTRQTGSAGARRRRSVLVIVELALAFVLLAGAGLLMRAFTRLVSWDPGFDRHGVALSWVLTPMNRYPARDAAVQLLERARDEAASVPGVRAVALASAGPLFGGGVESGSLVIEGGPVAESNAPSVRWFDIDPQYFDVLGLALVSGRRLAPADSSSAPPVALVNEAFARRFFAGSTAVGHRVTVMTHPSEIVGVIADVRPTRPDEAVPPEIYWPIRQFPRWAAYLVMRVDPSVSGIEAGLRARLARVDAAMQVTSPRPLDAAFEKTLVSPRFNMLLVSVFALVAVALAAIGVAGVTAFSVASRKREIGLRTALGASPGRLVLEFLREGLGLALGGTALGLAGAWALTGLLGSLLYGVPPTDPVAIGATIAGFAAVTFLACYIPARRATRVDPIQALRSD